jgi:hypothetical protein
MKLKIKTKKNKTNKHKSQKSKSKTRSKRLFGGNRCKTKYPRLEVLQNKIISFWNGDWRLPEVNETSKLFDIGRGKKANHHPVILNILRAFNGIDVNYALSLYCGESLQIKKPEYEEITIAFDGMKPETGTELSNFINRFAEDRNYTRANKLQPQNWQIFMLHFYIDTLLYEKLNTLQLPDEVISKQTKWENYIQLFSSREESLIDVNILGSSHDDDIDVRAGIVAERCIRNPKITKLYTMDGHGRFLCSLIKQIFHRDPRFFENRDFNIFVCDIDEEVNYWHRTTMPANVTIDANIFDVLNDTVMSDEMENSLFYLNFSGLGDKVQLDSININYTLYRDMGLLDNLIISFYTVRGASVNSKKLIGELNEISDSLQSLTERIDFKTIGTDIGTDYSTFIRPTTGV